MDCSRSVLSHGLSPDASISMKLSPPPQQESADNVPPLETELLNKLVATITDANAGAAEQMPAAGAVLQDQPLVQRPLTLSPTSFKLMSQLEEATRDFARAGEFNSECRRIESIPAEPEVFRTRIMPETEVSPNFSRVDFQEYPNKTPSFFGRRIFVSAAVAIVAGLGLGATWAWRSQLAVSLGRGHLQAAATSVNSLATQPPKPLAQIAPAIQSTPALKSGESLSEVVQKLNGIAQDLTSLRRGLEEVAAKQEHFTSEQGQIEKVLAAQGRLAAEQEQLAAKTDQMLQNIAKLKTSEQAKHKTPIPVAAPLNNQHRSGLSNETSDANAQSARAASSSWNDQPRLSPPLPVPPDYIPSDR